MEKAIYQLAHAVYFLSQCLSSQGISKLETMVNLLKGGPAKPIEAHIATMWIYHGDTPLGRGDASFWPRGHAAKQQPWPRSSWLLWSLVAKNGHLLLVMVIFHKGLKYLSKVGDVSCVEICTIHMEVTGVIGVSQNHRSHG